jgi:hypothetical protein
VHYRLSSRAEKAQLVRRAPALSLVDAVQIELRAWHLEILRSRSPLLVLSDSGPSSHHEALAREHAYKHTLYSRGFGEITLSFLRQAVPVQLSLRGDLHHP